MHCRCRYYCGCLGYLKGSLVGTHAFALAQFSKPTSIPGNPEGGGDEPGTTQYDDRYEGGHASAYCSEITGKAATDQLRSDSNLLIVFVANTCSYSRAVSVGSTLSLLSKLLGDQSLSTLHAHDPFITANKSEMILQARPFPSTYYVPECKIPA